MANTKITNPELFNLGDSTSATQLPVMITTQRVAMTGLAAGEMIFNSTTDKVEYWDGTKWYGITYETQVPPVLATSTLYLDASNTTSYPGTGSTWFNISGNSHNGSISGPIFNSGGWFDYDGTSDVVSIPSSTVFNATSSNSVSMGGWFYMTASQLNSFWSKGSGYGSMNYEYFCFGRTQQHFRSMFKWKSCLSKMPSWIDLQRFFKDLCPTII